MFSSSFRRASKQNNHLIERKRIMTLKYVFTIASAFALALSGTASEEAKNLFINPSFTSGQNGRITGWNFMCAEKEIGKEKHNGKNVMILRSKDRDMKVKDTVWSNRIAAGTHVMNSPDFKGKRYIFSIAVKINRTVNQLRIMRYSIDKKGKGVYDIQEFKGTMFPPPNTWRTLVMETEIPEFPKEIYFILEVFDPSATEISIADPTLTEVIK